MLKSSLCKYSDAYITVSGNITFVGGGAHHVLKAIGSSNKEVPFKNCALFTDCIAKINNTQVDNLKDLGVAMVMYNLIEYRDNY